jgi:hypothetical protein
MTDERPILMLIPNNLISPDYHLEPFDLTADGGHLEFHLEILNLRWPVKWINVLYMAAILDLKMGDVNYMLSTILRSHYGVSAVFMRIHPLIVVLIELPISLLLSMSEFGVNIVFCKD